MVLLTLSPNQETVKMQMHFLHPLALPGSAWDFGTTRYWNAGFATFFFCFPTFHRFLIVFQWLNSKAASLITHQSRSSLGNFGRRRDLISFRIQMRQTWADWGRERDQWMTSSHHASLSIAKNMKLLLLLHCSKGSLYWRGQHDKELFERAELNNTTIV